MGQGLVSHVRGLGSTPSEARAAGGSRAEEGWHLGVNGKKRQRVVRPWSRLLHQSKQTAIVGAEPAESVMRGCENTAGVGNDRGFGPEPRSRGGSGWGAWRLPEPLQLARTPGPACTVPPGLRALPSPLPILAQPRAAVAAKPKCRPLWKLLLKRLDLGTACPPASQQLPALRLLTNGWAESTCQ